MAAPTRTTVFPSLITLGKLAVSAGSLWLVFRSISPPSLQLVTGHIHWNWFLLALGIFWAAQVVSSLRCVYAARTIGGTLDLATSVRGHFVGLWFNQMLPSGVGGDAVKVAILKDHLGLGVALRAVLLDRASGLVFLLLSIVALFPLYQALLPGQPLVPLLGAACAAALLGLAVLAWLSAGTERLRGSWPKAFAFFGQVFADIWQFREPSALWKQTWTSSIVHLNGIVAYALMAKTLGLDVHFITFLLLTPVVFLAALLPISLAGWGVRELSAVWLFGLAGITEENALTISVGFGIMLLLAGVPGLLIFLFKKTAGHPSS